MIGNHTNVALSFSGGKDSVACVYMLRPWLDRITVYHVDSGDFLPETRDIVRQIEAIVPRFVRIQTNVGAWIETHGLPSDLVPYGSHPVGRAFGQAPIPLVSRYDCCFANVMWPLLERVMADGCTLLVRGTKAADVPKLPIDNGAVSEGIELLYPLQDWSHEEVLAYLSEVGAPISRAYDYGHNSIDCARCPGWWSEGRGAYLKKHHPEMFEEYRERMSRVRGALVPVLQSLATEVGAIDG